MWSSQNLDVLFSFQNICISLLDTLLPLPFSLGLRESKGDELENEKSWGLQALVGHFLQLQSLNFKNENPSKSMFSFFYVIRYSKDTFLCT
jgi:hypothetical protein